MRTFTFDEFRRHYESAIVESSSACVAPSRCPALLHMSKDFLAFLSQLEERHGRVVITRTHPTTRSAPKGRMNLLLRSSTKILSFEELAGHLSQIEVAGNARCTLPKECGARASTQNRFNEFVDDLKTGDGLVVLTGMPKYSLIAKRVSALERSPGRLNQSAMELVRQGAR
ncbi:MAG: hypothetical protein ACRDZW_06705 [Acidimicrobiales bacterium]